ncbi:MAG: hypothetical protein JNM78_15970 [Cyclobacteriaceae bacterium]|nr:hypothetical protein [Cyclobacteriaceae bacterium]
MKSLSLFWVLISLVFACTTKTNQSPEKNFYFEVKAHQTNQFTNSLSHFLKDKIPKQKYTITNQSGKKWPYYQGLELNETIPIDSLMPPHWYLHKMIPLEMDYKLTRDDHLVRIELMLQADTLPNYRVDIFENESNKLSLSATSGVHYIDSTSFPTRKLIYDQFLQSIIRYSFK